jgi:hypothetical protein
MRKPHVDDLVRLVHDVPDLELHRGQIGVVRSTWFAPSMAYEVEFDADGGRQQVRCLLDDAAVEIDFDDAIVANPA